MNKFFDYAFKSFLILCFIVFGVGYAMHETHQTKNITQANNRIPITYTHEVDRPLEMTDEVKECLMHTVEVAFTATYTYELNEELLFESFSNCIN